MKAYLDPQLFGALRDWTGGFATGFYAVATADAVTLGIILVLQGQLRGRDDTSGTASC